LREDIKVVINHFKKLYSNAKTLENSSVEEIVKERRWIVENYGLIDGKEPVIDPEIIIKKVNIRGVNCEWILAPNADKNKRLLFLHGGAFIAGSLDSHRALSCELSKRAGVSVLAVDYKLAPENPFPSGLEDCYDVYDWMLENSIDEKITADKVFISGDSAGGNLSLAILFLIRESNLRMPNAVLPISPVLDLFGKSPSVNNLDGFDPILNKKAFVKGLPLVYLFGKDVLKMNESKFKKISTVFKIITRKSKLIKNPLVSPIYGDLKNFPPILINVGDVEILRDDSIRFVDKARKEGVKASVKVWPNMIHVFVAFLGYLPEAEDCINDMANFIKLHS
jgi:monoterpene epsilon-lactone hydrolase